MPWVTRSGYSPGRRHYGEGSVQKTEPKPDWREGWVTWNESFATICGTGVRDHAHGMVQPDGSLRHTYGTLSVKEKVNLMQGNLCFYCKSAYIKARPELKALLDALKEHMEA